MRVEAAAAQDRGMMQLCYTCRTNAAAVEVQLLDIGPIAVSFSQQQKQPRHLHWASCTAK